MSGELEAKISEMRDAANTIRTSAGSINDSINAVDNEVRALGPDRFMGSAAEAFRDQYQRLTPRLREAYDNLMQFQEKLLLSADEIEAASRPTS